MIGNAPAADGMFTWDICSVIGDGEDYSVRISGTDDCGRTVEDFSDAVFSITGSLVPSLTLLTPIGGEQWSAGETQTITWASDAVAAVVLELYQGGEFHATIAIVLAASGSFEWDICSSIGDGDDYSIRIWGIDNCLEIIEDFSDPIFSITGSLVPSVALIAPNGGEMWETGTIQTIQWSSDSPDGFVEIEILKSGSFVTYATVFRAMAADGQLNWLIDPGLEEGSDYSVRIKVKTCLGTGTGVEDISESDFTIVLGPELDFRILSPNGGEALQAGTPQTISWTPLDIVQPIFLELFKAGEFHSFIALVDIGVGSIDWDICGDIPDGNDYSIHLDPFFQNQFLEDFSDAEFSITGATSLPVPMVTVVAPNGGEVIETGTLQTIEWASTNPVGNVTVWLLKDGLIRRLLAIAPMADEQFSWSVETDLEEADDYTVRIVITACLSGTFLRTDDSDAPFAIVPGVEP